MKAFFENRKNELVTEEQLDSLMPGASNQLISEFCGELNNQLKYYNINTPCRIAAFIAQGAVDTQDLSEPIETLNYSEKKILSLWPENFHMCDNVKAYANNPEKLGNFLYANQHGNGNSVSGDGYKYRGRGWFKTIGKENYETFSHLLCIDFVKYPDLLAVPRYAVLSACLRWTELALNASADRLDVRAIFTKLNGRYNHVNKRMAYYNRMLNLLPVTANPAILTSRNVARHK